MNKNSIPVKFFWCTIFAITFVNLACEEESDPDTTPDAAVDDDPLIPIDDCEEGGGNTLDECTDVDKCNCDNACGGNFFEFKVPDNLPPNARQSLKDYSQFENGIFYCYQKCGSGEECPDATDVCITYNENREREIDICTPTGTINLPNVPIKLLRMGAGFDVMNLAQTAIGFQAAQTKITDSVSFNMGDQIVPTDSTRVVGVYNQNQNTLVSAIAINIQFKNADNTQEWNLWIFLNGDNWEDGKVLDLDENDFALSLFHRDGGGKEFINWIEGIGYEGRIILGDVFPPSEDPLIIPVSYISIDVTLTRNRVGNQRGPAQAQ